MAEAAAGSPDRYVTLSLQVRRQRRLLWLAGFVAVMTTAGLVASQWVKSPAEVAAATAPPPSVITAQVSYGVLRSTVVFRGTFSSGRVVRFTPSAEVAPGGSGPGAQSLVVSRILTHAGARVGPGEVLLGISDRPLFVLTGAVPAFRDMVQGESGQDIAELQAALGIAGYSCAGDPQGTFGTATAAAVRRFYSAIGFGVPLIATAPATGRAGSQSGKQPSVKQVVEVPMSEVMFVPSFPATVTALPAMVGEQVTSPLISVALGELDLTGQLDPANAAEVRAGMRVQVLSDTTGRHASGIVTSVGRVVSPRQASPYLPVHIRPARRWQSSWSGQNVQLTVTSAATSRPVLSVPEAAISADASAVTYVTVAERGGTFRRVRVRAGISVDGLVAVTPVAGGLAAGDQVVVGG